MFTGQVSSAQPRLDGVVVALDIDGVLLVPNAGAKVPGNSW